MGRTGVPIGVFPPGSIPLEDRQAIFKDLKSRGIQVIAKITKKKPSEDEEELI